MRTHRRLTEAGGDHDKDPPGSRQKVTSGRARDPPGSGQETTRGRARHPLDWRPEPRAL